MIRRPLLHSIFLSLLCSTLASAGAAPTPDWRSHGRDSSEQRFSPLDQVTAANVAQLGVAWVYEMQDPRGVEATPLVVNGIMYVTSAWSIVYAIDARTGTLRWKYDPQVPRQVGAKSCCDVVNRGVAYTRGRILLAVLDGRLISLNAITGALQWSVDTVAPDPSRYVITGAPRIAGDLVLIGNSGGDLGARGYVSAYKLDSGHPAWRFYTVPGDPAKGKDHAASDSVWKMMAGTWRGSWWKEGGGGSVWDSMTYDAELDRVYIGVDNGAPWNRQIRSPEGGDNLFLASIVALDRKTGRYLWHYQVTPGDTWDSGATQSIVLATVTLDGKRRRVLMQAPKNGFFYVIDRDTGKLVSARNFVPMAKTSETAKGQPISWAYGIDLATGRPLENAEARFLNGATALVHPVGPGAHGWQPMAYSPKTGLAYFPVQDFASSFKTDVAYVPGPYLRASGLEGGGAIPQVPKIRESIPKRLAARLVAWNPVDQTEAWRVTYDFAGNGGVLATAGDVVFEGASTGVFNAYDATTGARLWSFDAQATAQGGPVSYSVDDEQYIAIAIGNGGSTFLAGALAVPEQRGTPTGRVVAFKLNATGAYPRIDTKPTAVPPPPAAPSDAAAVKAGAERYGAYCSGCHGFGAISGFVTPDLRRSAYIQNAEAFRIVVQDGVLLNQGMPKFGAGVSKTDAENIRSFLISEANYVYSLQHSKDAKAPATP